MKKYAIYLIALSAVSTASLASQGDHEPRDLNACLGECPGQLGKAAPKVSTRAFIENAGAAAGFEQLDKNPEENHQGGREGGRE